MHVLIFAQNPTKMDIGYRKSDLSGYSRNGKIDTIFLRGINGGVDSVSRSAIERILKHTAPADSDVPVPSIESPRIYCAPIVEFSYRTL